MENQQEEYKKRFCNIYPLNEITKEKVNILCMRHLVECINQLIELLVGLTNSI